MPAVTKSNVGRKPLEMDVAIIQGDICFNTILFLAYIYMPLYNQAFLTLSLHTPPPNSSLHLY